MTLSTLAKTAHAPAERVSFNTIKAQAKLLEEAGPLASILQWLPLPTAVVNAHRQIVFLNQAFLALLKRDDTGSILGLRIGEALECPRSIEDLGGCGTTQECRGCGITTAVLSALENGEAVSPAHVTGELDGQRTALSCNEAAYAFQCGETRLVLVLLHNVKLAPDAESVTGNQPQNLSPPADRA